MSKIKWNLPDSDDGGFLRRRRELVALLDKQDSVKGMDELLKFLVQFVEGSEKEAMEALLDCSRAEYGQAILPLMGYQFKVSDPKGGRSATQ